MALPTSYVVNNGNYADKDLSEIFVSQVPTPYAVLDSPILAEDFVSASSTFPSGWIRGGSGSGGVIKGQSNNPGQVELLTNSGNGSANIYYTNVYVGIAPVQNIQMDFIVKTPSAFTGDNQQVYAGISTTTNPPAQSGAKNVYIGIVPTTGGAGAFVEPRFVGFINNQSSTSTPTAGSDVAYFNTVWNPNDWYHLKINIDIVNTTNNTSTSTVTFTVKNLTDPTGQPSETKVVTSSAVAVDTSYNVIFEQRIDSSTKYFYVDYIGYNNKYEVTRNSP